MTEGRRLEFTDKEGDHFWVGRDGRIHDDVPGKHMEYGKFIAYAQWLADQVLSPPGARRETIASRVLAGLLSESSGAYPHRGEDTMGRVALKYADALIALVDQGEEGS